MHTHTHSVFLTAEFNFQDFSLLYCRGCFCQPLSVSPPLFLLFCAQVVQFPPSPFISLLLPLISRSLNPLWKRKREEMRNNPAFQAHPLLFPLRSTWYCRTEGLSSWARTVKASLCFSGHSPVIQRQRTKRSTETLSLHTLYPVHLSAVKDKLLLSLHGTFCPSVILNKRTALVPLSGLTD